MNYAGLDPLPYSAFTMFTMSNDLDKYHPQAAKSSFTSHGKMGFTSYYKWFSTRLYLCFPFFVITSILLFEG